MTAFGAEQKCAACCTDFRSPLKSGHSCSSYRMARYAFRTLPHHRALLRVMLATGDLIAHATQITQLTVEMTDLNLGRRDPIKTAASAVTSAIWHRAMAQTAKGRVRLGFVPLAPLPVNTTSR